MSYKDIRTWLSLVERDGELKKLHGVSWDLEMSGLTEILYREGKRPVPALLFDDIPGYPLGYRTLFGMLSSPRRLCSALCLPVSEDASVGLRAWREKLRGLKPIPPKTMASGSSQENQITGDSINLYSFPSPRFHESDGGRYIGTGCSVIVKDPDTEWVNLGTYRCMLVDSKHLALHMLEGQHGRLICDKYFSRKQVMPVAVAIGIDPVLLFLSGERLVPSGISEYDYAGGIKGEPIEVIKGAYTGLPLPASAEILIEGECHPDDLVDEGPFGEWHGYYGNMGLSPVPEPVMRVKTILYRSAPILTCSHPSVPPSEMSFWSCMSRAASIWDRLERFGIPGIQSVWCHEEGGGQLFTVVSVRQMYAGHSKRVGLVTSQANPTGSRYTIVVDDDIDPSNLSQVVWAVVTRSDPERSTHILSGCAASASDPIVPLAQKKKEKGEIKSFYCSRAVIDACQPFEHRNEWYPVAKISPTLREQLLSKWGNTLRELCP